MTVVKMQDGNYIGLSADVKPTSDVPPGVKFIEHDNDRIWIYDGTSWREIENVFLDSPHKWVHLGKMWGISNRWVDVADAASADLVIEVGDTGLHTIYEVASEGLHYGFIYEGTTLSSAGSVGTVRNQNRVIGDSGAPTVKVDPTVSAAGTLLLSWFMPGGSGGQASGNTAASREEIILAPSTTYLFRATNMKGQAADMSWMIHAYEHD